MKKLLVWLSLLMMITIVPLNCIVVMAEQQIVKVEGKAYVFGADEDYTISQKTYKSTNDQTARKYGEFSIAGDISDVSLNNNVPAYKISNGKLNIAYKYSNSLLKDNKDTLHLYEDKCDTIDGIKIGEKIKNGVIMLQTSRDRINWTSVVLKTDVFKQTPSSSSTLYTASDIQLNNGCYYRMIVAYETEIRVGTKKVGFIEIDQFEYARYAEVYEFYAYNENASAPSVDNSLKYSLGKAVRTEKFDGYVGETVMTTNDVHYGWDLGNFFVSGFSSSTKDENGNVVFLKNVGDKVTLYFNLKQNINNLNGDSKLKISADTAGYDQYFQTSKQDFGRGTLIIRYTDYQNIAHDPVIYTDFLEADATIGADTIIQLYEEGDYEVALDYQITDDKLLAQKSHYRIFFKYSIRNGNCMVYPFDVKTGEELNNAKITPNGFRLDLAKSRYLDINIRKEVLAEGADGLIEDTRYNRPAKDGESFEDEGIYTIKVTNKYTKESETKKIYVGTNDVLRASVITNMSISEINEKLANGYRINEDGELELIKVDTTIQETKSLETKKEDDTSSDLSNNDKGCGGVVIDSIAVYSFIIMLTAVCFWAKKENGK